MQVHVECGDACKTTNAVDGPEGLGVGVDYAGSIAGDGEALLVVVDSISSYPKRPDWRPGPG